MLKGKSVSKQLQAVINDFFFLKLIHVRDMSGHEIAPMCLNFPRW